MEQSDYLEAVIEEFQEITQKPEVFLSCEEAYSIDLKSKLKHSYDFLKLEGILSSSALPELLINNFDTEQIWQQIELQNEAVLKNSLKSISRLLTNKDRLVFENLAESIDDDKHYSNDDSTHEEETEIDPKGLGPNEKESNTNELEQPLLEDSDEEVDLNDQEFEEENFDLPEKPKKGKKSIVDDEFFKLDEMESFLKAEEKRENDPSPAKNNAGSDSESEDSIDLFEDDADNDDDDDKVKTAKFKDFFVAKDDFKETKRNRFLKDMSDDEEDNQIKSTLELRQERLNKKIEEIEENAVNNKPWTLKGEITADSRPQNSLLEEIVEFDLSSRPAPIITEKTTQQLEDIIRQRIKDKIFDSVVRKAKPIETPLEYKKKLVLDQEKSKHSLAQLYEKEYLEQQATLDPAYADKEEVEPELHKEIKTMMRGLFNKLDALSNFHFTPKPAIPELKIITNLPAVVMEEVAPITASDAALLAPEELRQKPKGDIIGKSERTKTDKNREKRKKKQKQHIHMKKIINKNLITGGRNDKNKTNLKQVLKNKNIEKMNQSPAATKAIKSSKAFFTQLQEDVQTHINNRRKPKKTNKELKAKKLKL